MFDSIATLAVASNMRELYRLVLVDTPLAPYFSENLTHEVSAWVAMQESCRCKEPCDDRMDSLTRSLLRMMQDLDEMNIEIMRNTLYKAYLDDFAEFCQSVGGTTGEVMGDLLAFEVRMHGCEDGDSRDCGLGAGGVMAQILQCLRSRET